MDLCNLCVKNTRARGRLHWWTLVVVNDDDDDDDDARGSALSDTVSSAPRGSIV